MAATMLRVHSKDLHEHVVAEVADCLSSGLFTDTQIRCKDGEVLHAHSLVLAAVSPYLRLLIKDPAFVLPAGSTEDAGSVSLDLSDYGKTELENLLSIVYTGSIDASVEEIKRVILLAHSLYIPVPVSDQLNSILGIDVASLAQPPLMASAAATSSTSAAASAASLMMEQAAAANLQGVGAGGGGLTASDTLAMLQQQILGQYAIINGLVAASKIEPVAASSVLKKDLTSPGGGGLTAMNGLNLLPQVASAAAGGPTVAAGQIGDQDSIKNQAKNHLNEIINSAYSKSLKDKSSNVYHCTICNSTYNHPGNFKQHMLKHEREARGRLDRGVGVGGGGGSAGSSADGGNHLNAVLQSAFADRVDNGDPSKLYVCGECNRTFKHPGNYKQHMASHNRPVLTMAPYLLEAAAASNTSPTTASAAAGGGLKRPVPGLVKVAGEPPEKKRPSLDTKSSVTTAPSSFLSTTSTTSSTKKSTTSTKTSTSLKASHHSRSAPANGWQCPTCKVKFEVDTELQRHMKAEHDIEMVIPPPPVLPVSSSAAAAVGRETIAAADIVKEELLLEDTSSTDDGDLLAASADVAYDPLTGAARALISCDVPGCYQSFSTTGWLARHKTKMHPNLVEDLGPSIFSCTQCGKDFNKMSKLTQHVKTHSPESHYRYPCDICGKKFTRPQHVNRHKLLHTGERPFSCQTCDKAFTREDKLKHHLRAGCPGIDLANLRGAESIGMVDIAATSSSTRDSLSDGDEEDVDGEGSRANSVEDGAAGLEVGVVG